MAETAAENLLSPRHADQLLAIMTVVSEENYLTLTEVLHFYIICFSQLHMEFLEPLGRLFHIMWRRHKDAVKICEPAISKWWIVQWEIRRYTILRGNSMR